MSRARGIAWSGVEASASGAFSLVSAFVIARLTGPTEMGVGAAVASVHVLLWVGVNALFAPRLRISLDLLAAAGDGRFAGSEGVSDEAGQDMDHGVHDRPVA